jgi:hypothetical protein
MENELNKQTAVEWLVEKLQESGIPLMTDEFEMIQQAKEMEKEQRIQDMSKMQIISDVDFDGDVTFMFNPKEYYNETYGKKTFLDLVSDEESKVHEVVRKLKEKKK